MGTRALLLMAHPGHELVVHNWLHRESPRICVLTDGSTRETSSRLDSTVALVDRSGATTGSLFGRFTDERLYERILDRDTELFTQLAREIAKDIVDDPVSCVVGDAAEGYNVVHDLFRQVINAGVAIAASELGQTIDNFEYALFDHPQPPTDEQAACKKWELTGAARDEKFAAARAYAELDREVRVSLERHGIEAYATEWLRPVRDGAGEYRVREDPPIYERFGEHLRREGQFAEVIRYREHVLPIVEALGDAARLG